MKSLEIIKRKINEIYGFDDKWEEVEELEQIKQDLEVLEIIRKKDVLTRVLKCCLKESENDDEALDSYNFHFPDNRDLTMEELLKIKQWLEENDNE